MCVHRLSDSVAETSRWCEGGCESDKIWEAGERCVTGSFCYEAHYVWYIHGMYVYD